MDIASLKITFLQISPYLFTLSLTFALGILLARLQSLKKDDKSFTLTKKIKYYVFHVLWIFVALMVVTLVLIGITL